jgi:hypothetical protein
MLSPIMIFLTLKMLQVHTLYSASSSTKGAARDALLLSGRRLLREAGAVMDRRAAAFRVPEERIAGWRQGPTVYPYGYVWAARSL